MNTKFTIILFLASVIHFDSMAQFFVQQLDQTEITNAEEIYVVMNNGDTLQGEIRGTTLSDSVITRFTIKSGEERIKITVEEITRLAVRPGLGSNYRDMALIPAVKETDNDAFLEVLPEDGWVFYDRITLPGKRQVQALSQLLNPGWDNKIKVYKDRQASNIGGSSINGLLLEGGLDDSHLVSIDGKQTFRIGNFGYRKKSLDLLYENCSQLANQKLRWKDFAKHVFIYDQECIDTN